MRNSTIVFDTESIIIEKYKGIGVQWDPHIEYPLNEEQWNKLLSRIDFMKPGFIRCMIYAKFYCIGLDADNNPIYDFENEKHFKPLLKILDYCECRGIDVVLGEWEAPAAVVKEGPLSEIECDNLLWAKMIVGLLKYLLKVKQYTCIKYFNYINEPNGDWSRCADYEKWKSGILNLDKEMEKSNLKGKVKIIGPDTAWNLDWIDYTVRDLSNIIGMYDFHWYPEDKDVSSGSMEKMLKPKRELISAEDTKGKEKDFMMTEAGLVTGKTNGDQQPNVKNFSYGVGMADLAVQTMRAGVSGICAWDIDDAMHINSGFNGYSYENYPFPPNEYSMKIWGAYNSYGTIMGIPEDENLRPWYYVWSLMSRLFPVGCKIMNSEATDLEGLRTVAMKEENGQEQNITIMVVNNSSEARFITVKIPSIDYVDNLVQYNFFNDDRPTDDNGFPVPVQILKDVKLSEGHTISLPSQGVIMLTTL